MVYEFIYELGVPRFQMERGRERESDRNSDKDRDR